MSTPLPRAHFPICRARHYLNHASVNAISLPVAEAMEAWVAAALEGETFSEAAQAQMEAVRADAARLLGATASEVAFVKNTSEGLAFVAAGLDWEPGDRVVIPATEFPSNVYPWKALARRGVTVDLVAPSGSSEAFPVEAFEKVIGAGPPPRLVATSWVQFRRGWRTDLTALAEVAHRAGSLLCVDLVQGLGVQPCDLGGFGVDFAACGSHKWLLGPAGIGLFYVRHDVMERLAPAEPGWASVAHREQWENLDLVWDQSARRYESGTANLVGIAGLGATLALLLQAGPEAIWAHVDGLCHRLTEGLADLGATVLSERRGEGRSAIVTFSVEGHDPGALVEHLGASQVVVAPRGGGIRVSPHGYNDEEDVDALLAALKTAIRP